MRPLFLVLVLINLGYFAWQRQQQVDESAVQSGPLAVAPHSNTLTLLSEIHTSPSADAPPRSNTLQEAPTPQSP
jgi:hypothetical protein